MTHKDLVQHVVLQVLTNTTPATTSGAAPAPAALRGSAAKPRFSADRVRWILRLWIMRLGTAGKLGLGMATFALLFYVSAVAPAKDELREAKGELAVMQARVHRAGGGDAPALLGPVEELAKFYGLFPSDYSVPDALRAIYHLGTAQHLQIEQAEYRVATEGQSRLYRYDISFPVTGTYPEIRKFLRSVSTATPTAALDKVTFEHRNGKADQVQAKVSLLLFSKRDR